MNKSTLASKQSSKMPYWQIKLAGLEGAYADGTIRAYGADIQCFASWCDRINRKPFPATPKLLAKFIVHEAERCSASTLKRRLAAIGKMHRLMRFENPVQDEEVKLALRRAFRGKFSRPKQALGLSEKIRDQLIEACSNNTLSDIRDKALIAVGYDALSRRSELSSIDLEDLSLNESGGKLIIRRSKNDQYGNGRVAYISNKSASLLKDWIKAANISKGPIFRSLKNERVSSDGLHPHSISRIIKRAAVRAGLPEHQIKCLSGHSMRIGAAQDMMLAGLDLLPIMAAGGWKTTNVVARYIENADLSPLLHRSLRPNKFR